MATTQIKEKTAEQALSTLQWLCSRMERCESDARRSLYRWQVPRHEWDGVIAKLVKDKFIDDERYAGAYVRSKVAASNWGRTKIITALKTKRIAPQIIEKVMSEYAPKEGFSTKLTEFITSKIDRERPRAKNAYDLRARVFRAAASRGYDFEQINDILDKYLKDEDF